MSAPSDWRGGWHASAKGCSSTGRAAVSKTAGCRFKSCHPCVRRRRVEDGVTEDHEQDRTEERDTTARPVTAAARRERRASARGEMAKRGGVEDRVPAGKA